MKDKGHHKLKFNEEELQSGHDDMNLKQMETPACLVIVSNQWSTLRKLCERTPESVSLYVSI